MIELNQLPDLSVKLEWSEAQFALQAAFSEIVGGLVIQNAIQKKQIDAYTERIRYLESIEAELGQLGKVEINQTLHPAER